MNAPLMVSRVLFGGFFVFSGINHFINLQSMSAWVSARGLPWPSFWVLLTGAMILLGGTSVIIGYRPRLGLLLIIAFLIPVSLVMHNFWAMADTPQRMIDMTNFLKNTALVGAAFGLMAVPRPWPNSVSSKGGRAQSSDWLTGRQLPH